MRIWLSSLMQATQSLWRVLWEAGIVKSMGPFYQFSGQFSGQSSPRPASCHCARSVPGRPSRRASRQIVARRGRGSTASPNRCPTQGKKHACRFAAGRSNKPTIRGSRPPPGIANSASILASEPSTPTLVTYFRCHARDRPCSFVGTTLASTFESSPCRLWRWQALAVRSFRCCSAVRRRRPTRPRRLVATGSL